jgi:hypothetical protein
MPFRRYVSVGRVAYVNLAEDPLYGKLVVIVDIVDQNRVRHRRCLQQTEAEACCGGLQLQRAPTCGDEAATARACKPSPPPAVLCCRPLMLPRPPPPLRVAGQPWR